MSTGSAAASSTSIIAFFNDAPTSRASQTMVGVQKIEVVVAHSERATWPHRYPRRFASPTTIVIDKPAFDDRNDPWVRVAARTMPSSSSP